MPAFVILLILFVLYTIKHGQWFMAFIGCLTLLWVVCGRSWRNPRLWWWI
jgi:hypothetical protein